jgi:DNA-nicking Smr family endonuclease
MGRKKRQQPSKPQEFQHSPFSDLKGISITPAQPESTHPAAPLPRPPVPTEKDDDELFQRAMSGVRTLGDQSDPRHAEEGKISRESRVKAVNSEVSTPAGNNSAASVFFLQEISRLKLEVTFTEQFPDEDELKPLSGNRLRQLKRGIISVSYQLDLHGLTRDEALAELPRFLRSARLKGQRAVLIITGKGNNSVAEPVLQQAVAGWLRDAGRELLVEFAPAPREMGGSGAFVVFLRPYDKSQ